MYPLQQHDSTVRTLIQTAASWHKAIGDWLTSLPFWPEVVKISLLISGPVIALSRWTLGVMPSLRRAEWLLEIEALSRRHPVGLAFALSLVAFRGLLPSQNGHIGTAEVIFPLLGGISGFNPYLGLLCGVAYGVADIFQKLLWNDIYDTPGGRMSVQYWGAMIGYCIAYSSTVAMGMLPGVSSRVCRLIARNAVQKWIHRNHAAAADGARPSGDWTPREGAVPQTPPSRPAGHFEGAQAAAQQGANVGPVVGMYQQGPAQQPVWLDLNRPENQSALRELLNDPRDLFRDPDSWRSANLTPHQKLLMANLRGKRMLGPDAAARLKSQLGVADLNAPPPDAAAQAANLTAVELAALMGGAGLAGVLTQAVISPVLVVPAFYLRPNPDVSCYAAELRGLTTSSPLGGFGSAVGAGATALDGARNGGPPNAQTPAELVDRVRQIDLESSGNPSLMRDAQAIIDRYNRGGGIDPQAVADLQNAYDNYRGGVIASADAANQAALDRNRDYRAQQAAKQAAEDAAQRDLINRYGALRDRFSGPNASAGALEALSNAGPVTDAQGRIDPAKLRELERTLLGAQQDALNTAAALSNARSDAAENALAAARGLRDVSILVSSAGLGGAFAAGVAGNLAAAGFSPLATAALTGFATGGVVGGVAGGITGASEGGSVSAGLRGARDAAIQGAVMGGLIAPLAPILPSNPAVAGALFGAGHAALTGGNVWKGALEGAVAGQLGHMGANASAANPWGRTVPVPESGNAPRAVPGRGTSPRVEGGWGRSPWDATGYEPNGPRVATSERGTNWGRKPAPPAPEPTPPINPETTVSAIGPDGKPAPGGPGKVTAKPGPGDTIDAIGPDGKPVDGKPGRVTAKPGPGDTIEATGPDGKPVGGKPGKVRANTPLENTGDAFDADGNPIPGKPAKVSAGGRTADEQAIENQRNWKPPEEPEPTPAQIAADEANLSDLSKLSAPELEALHDRYLRSGDGRRLDLVNEALRRNALKGGAQIAEPIDYANARAEIDKYSKMDFEHLKRLKEHYRATGDKAAENFIENVIENHKPAKVGKAIEDAWGPKTDPDDPYGGLSNKDFERLQGGDLPPIERKPLLPENPPPEPQTPPAQKPSAPPEQSLSDVDTNPNIPPPRGSKPPDVKPQSAAPPAPEESSLGAKTDPNITPPRDNKPPEPKPQSSSPPAPEESSLGAKTDPNITPPENKTPPPANVPEEPPPSKPPAPEIPTGPDAGYYAKNFTNAELHDLRRYWENRGRGDIVRDIDAAMDLQRRMTPPETPPPPPDDVLPGTDIRPYGVRVEPIDLNNRGAELAKYSQYNLQELRDLQAHWRAKGNNANADLINEAMKMKTQLPDMPMSPNEIDALSRKTVEQLQYDLKRAKALEFDQKAKDIEAALDLKAKREQAEVTQGGDKPKASAVDPELLNLNARDQRDLTRMRDDFIAKGEFDKAKLCSDAIGEQLRSAYKDAPVEDLKMLEEMSRLTGDSRTADLFKKLWEDKLK
jgi:hypothetical protein